VNATANYEQHLQYHSYNLLSNLRPLAVPVERKEQNERFSENNKKERAQGTENQNVKIIDFI
jgi:hypothetical protein